MNCKKLFILLLYSCSFCLSYGQDKPQLVTTTGHQGRIESISFSSNGRYVASANDKTLKIYDLVMQLEFNSILFPSPQGLQQVKFSSDDKYIFVIGLSEYYTISHPEGKIIHQKKIEWYHGNREHCFIGSNDKIYFISDWNGLTVYDPLKGEVEKLWKDIKLLNILYLSKQDIIVGSEYDRSDKKKFNLSLFNASTGERIKSISMPAQKTYRKAFVTDDNEEFVALEMDSARIKIFNAKTFSLVSQMNFPRPAVSDIEFYPDRKKIIASGYDSALVVFDIATGKLLQKFNAETLNGIRDTTLNMATAIYDIEFSPNGKLLAVPYQCLYAQNKEVFTAFRIAYYNTSDMKMRYKYEGQDKGLISVFVNKDESKMITLNRSTPLSNKVWDLKKGEIEGFYNFISEWKYADDYVVTNYYDKDKKQYSVRAYKFPGMKLLSEHQTIGHSFLEISPDGKLFAALSFKYIAGMTSPEYKFSIWETETGKELYNRKIGKMERFGQFHFNKNNQLLFFDAIARDSFRVECINPFSGKTEKSLYLDFTHKRNDPSSHLLLEFDKSGDEIFFLSSNTEFFELRSKNINSEIITTHIHEDIFAGPLVMKFNHDYSKMALFLHDYRSPKVYRVYIYDWVTKKRIKIIEDFSFPINCMDFSSKAGNLYVGDNNGVVTIIGSDYEKKAFMLTESDRNYLILSPDNYYKTSITNTQGIGFRYKNELYRFDQFDLRYNRPDIVLGGMGFVSETHISLYKEAWLKRLKRLGFDEQTVNSSSIHAPEIVIARKDDLPYSTTDGSIKFTISATDSLYDLKSIALYVNNVPLYGKNGFTIPGAGVRKFSKDIEVLLGEGKNKISVSVFNSKGVESTRESFVMECTKNFAKPDLYIFAVGVSKYKDSTMNLTYSDKDVKDIAALFTEKNKINLYYANVYVKLLTNKEATVSNVQTAAAFLKNSKPNDQVILFYSGHGLIDPKLDYYVAMNDVDFMNPASGGLLYTHFQDLFDGLQARKRLLLIDACHSGEIDKDEYTPSAVASNSEEQVVVEKELQFRGKKVIGISNANELMKELFTDLRKETGATVIASSSGTEYSVESPTWKNGVFTFALKEALSNMKGDRNKDKKITLTEAREYLIQRVKELTGGEQNPTTRQENIEFDYRLW
jgi:WD40 repeat protein